MSPRLPLLLIAFLAACGTPQEQCINRVTRELRLISDLIAETELNLARGYEMEEYTIYRSRWVYCSPPYVVQMPDGSQRVVRTGEMCLDDFEDTVERPRAIDPVAERNKLKGLQDRQRALTRATEPAIEECRLRYPQ
jgi:hypothetical protein